MGTTAKPIRENRAITVDFQSEATYFQLLGDGKAFLECVIAFIMSLSFQLKHKATCRGGECLTRHSHYMRVRLSGVTICVLHVLDPHLIAQMQALVPDLSEPQLRARLRQQAETHYANLVAGLAQDNVTLEP